MHKSFGERIRVERKKLNLTNLELAKRCGVSRSYITLIENGYRLPGKKILLKIALSLGLKTSIVLNWYLEHVSQEMLKTLGDLE